jgi:hypothetical protein
MPAGVAQPMVPLPAGGSVSSESNKIVAGWRAPTGPMDLSGRFPGKSQSNWTAYKMESSVSSQEQA